jgi:hypothetical protein
MGVRKKIDEEQLCCLYIEGKSTTELGRQFGCSNVCIGDRLKQLGVKMRPSLAKKEYWTPEQKIKTKAHNKKVWTGRKHRPETLVKMLASKSSPEQRKIFSECRLGEKHPLWKGGSHFHGGYKMILVKDHPLSRPQRSYFPEHRILMERKVGRPLLKRERVHHVDAVKSNNSYDNLVLLRHEFAHRRIHGFATRHKIHVGEITLKQPWFS